MRLWRARLLLLAGGSTLLASIPALSQQTLPPGFGDPQAPPTTTIDEPERPVAPPPPPPPPSAPDRQRTPAPRTAPVDSAQEDLQQLVPVRPPRLFDVPEEARLPADMVGPLGPEHRGLGTGAFGNANGVYLAGLMRRLDAPLPSRWTSMLLRRALLSRVAAPPGVAPVDWVAQRAWLLLRMGEADAARMLVQAVEVPDYTPTMIQVAVQTALANSDPAGLCPLVEPGRAISQEPVWLLSDAICAALSGEDARAGSVAGQARNRAGVHPVDLALTQKIVGAASDVRRSVSVQWDEVDQINSWRFGLATAAGLEIPERLMNGAGRQVHAWYARAPMVPFEQRLSAADTAASLGVFSSSALVDLYSMIADTGLGPEGAGATALRLREAYVHRDPERRIEALRALWQDAETADQRHARRILTAVAATRAPVSEEHVGDAADLVASMLTAGLDREAARWAPVVQGSSESGAAIDRAWALLAVGTPSPVMDVSVGRIAAFRDADESPRQIRSRMLVAALAGLGRIDAATATQLAGEMDLRLGREGSWARALDAAARARQPGTVALLAGVGMQTGSWSNVPPEHLFRILRALAAVGLDYEARMIATEALSRL